MEVQQQDRYERYILISMKVQQLFHLYFRFHCSIYHTICDGSYLETVCANGMPLSETWILIPLVSNDKQRLKIESNTRKNGEFFGFSL